MKTLLCLLPLVFGLTRTTSAQSDTLYLGYQDAIDSIFGVLNPEDFSYNRLYNRSLPLIDYREYNGNDTSRPIQGDTLLELYSELYYAQFDNSNLNNVYALDSITNVQMPPDSGIIPIMLIDWGYSVFKDSVFEDSLMIIENNQIHDASSSQDTPWINSRVFGVAPLTSSDIDTIVRFKLPSSLFFSDFTSYDQLQIDFDDGLGYRNLKQDSIYTIPYSEDNNYTISVIAIRNSDTLYSTSTFSFKTFQEQASGIEPDQTYTIDVNGVPNQYGVWYGCGNTCIHKAVIIIEGFDPTNERDLDTPDHEGTWYDCLNANNLVFDKNLYCVVNSQNLADDMRDLGYDIIILNFTDGAADMQTQALAVKQLIRDVNDKLNDCGSSEELVIIGPSQGGVAVRQALAEMEAGSEDHNTRLFISFDAPHQGATIPLSLQHFVKFAHNSFPLALVSEVKDLWKILNITPTKQLLVYHCNQTNNNHAAPAPEFVSYQTLLANLNNGKGYPEKPRMVAISNGSHDASDQGYDDGDRLFALGVPAIYTMLVSGFAVPDNYLHTIFTGYVSFHGIIFGLAYVKVNNTEPFDNAPGGTTNNISQLPNAPPIVLTYTIDHPENFIPVYSALDLQNTTDLFYNVEANLSSYRQDGTYEYYDLPSNITPFDAFFISPDNEQHVIDGVTPDIAKFIKKEVTTYYIKDGHQVTWNTDKEIAGKVVIEDGGSLTITSTIKFTEGAGIDVLKGGELIVDGGTLTSLDRCDATTMWRGITVYGDGSKPHPSLSDALGGSHPDHGLVVVKEESLIENARNAIGTTYGNDKCITVEGGGIIYCANSEFKNNRRSIEFLQFNPKLCNSTLSNKNSSKITHCNFIKDEDSRVEQGNQEAFITLWGVEGVYLIRNHFINNDPSSFSSLSDLGKGIKSIDAQYNVLGQCTSLTPIGGCQSWTSSQFINLERGIEIDNTIMPPAPVFVDKAYFENFKEGVALSGGGNSLKLIRSEFYLPDNDFTTALKSGIYINGSTGYIIEENEFWQHYGGSQGDAGIRVHNNGPSGDQLYKNYFHDIEDGVIAQQDNRGLQIKCNTFESPIWWINMAVTSAPGLSDQGECLQTSDPLHYDSPAGNTISHDCPGTFPADFYNATQNQIVYNHHTGSSYELQCYSTTVDDNDCNFTFNGTYACLTNIDDDGKTDPDLPTAKLAAIDETLEGETDEGEYEWLMKHRVIEVNRLVQEYLLQDSLYGIDSALAFLELDTFNHSQTLLIPLKIHEGDWEEAAELLDSLDQRNAYYESFYDLYDWIVDQLIADSTYMNASSDELATLEAIVDDSTTFSANAQVLLALLDSQAIELVYEDLPVDEENKKGDDIEPNYQSNTGFYVAPNPASETVTIHLQTDSKAILYLYDLHGLKMASTVLPEDTDLHLLDIHKLRQGIYLLQILQDDEIYEAKLAIVR